VGLSWPLFEGGITRAQVREQQANLSSIEAQRDALRQQVRLEVERAQLSATNAAVQRVQATYNLATARTELARALGRQVGSTG
jgi:outer membrane protein